MTGVVFGIITVAFVKVAKYAFAIVEEAWEEQEVEDVYL